jgi:hypothetical protein
MSVSIRTYSSKIVSRIMNQLRLLHFKQFTILLNEFASSTEYINHTVMVGTPHLHIDINMDI